MKRTGAVLALVAGALLVASGPVEAANKEHQQIMAEIRMLQEQQQQLQQMLGSLAESLKAIATQIESQSGVTRKAFADQNLILQNIAEGSRILREKADDTNVRLSTMTQEIQALRQTVASLPPPQALTPPDAGTGVAPGEPGAMPSFPTAPPAAQVPPPNVSPTRMYEQSFADYTAGEYDLAVDGFQAFIRTFPTSPMADDAQLLIGNSLYNSGKFQEAVAAYQRVISDYPQGDQVAAAYYKVGLAYERLNQLDLARKAHETVVKEHPSAPEAVLAKQRLDVLTDRRDE